MYAYVYTSAACALSVHLGTLHMMHRFTQLVFVCAFTLSVHLGTLHMMHRFIQLVLVCAFTCAVAAFIKILFIQGWFMLTAFSGPKMLHRQKARRILCSRGADTAFLEEVLEGFMARRGSRDLKELVQAHRFCLCNMYNDVQLCLPNKHNSSS